MLRYKTLIILLLCGLGTIESLAERFVGKVVDENNNPLIGAVVALSNGKLAVASDNNGIFEFSVPEKKTATVSVKYVGYLPSTFIIRADNSLKDNTLTLAPDPAALDEVVITATRTPKPLKDVPVVTRLINADEIKRADVNNIQDLLTEEIPGLEFTYAMTQETSLNMSGFGGSSILFLVDGERLAGETMDNVDYNRLNLENVGQVEIVKGASSALYGANAVGGVVNLISKENTEPWHVNLSSRYKAEGHEWRTGGTLNFNSGKWNSSTSLQHTTADNVRLTSPFDAVSAIHELYGGRTINLKERLVFRPYDYLRFIARGGYFNRIGNRANYHDHFHDYTGGLKTVWDIDGTQNLELSYSYDRFNKSRFIGGNRTNDHDYSNRQHILHGMYTRFWGSNALTVGADYMHDYLTTYQFIGNAAHWQTTADLFVQYDYSPVSWLEIIGSVRDDYFSASKNNALTARLATMFKFTHLSIRASYAGGFRAPTLKEMYMEFDMAGIQMIYGNPDLKPARSHHFNLALERSGAVNAGIMEGTYTLTLGGYYNHYLRRITIMDFPGTDTKEPGAIYANEKGVKVGGIDFTGRYYTRFGLGATISYNYLHVAGRSIDSQFTQPRPHSATWKLSYERQICSPYRIYVALSGRYLSKPESEFDTDGAYSIWKFTLQQKIWRGINLNFVIDNLFNYKPKVYYWNSPPTTGITWSVGLTLNVNDLF